MRKPRRVIFRQMVSYRTSKECTKKRYYHYEQRIVSPGLQATMPCSQRWRHVLFLPPYSLDLNPIEKVWANMKRTLIDIMPRVQNIGNAIIEYLHKGN